MKLKLKKKNMKTLIDDKVISSDMTPQVAGGIRTRIRTRIKTREGFEKPTAL